MEKTKIQIAKDFLKATGKNISLAADVGLLAGSIYATLTVPSKDWKILAGIFSMICAGVVYENINERADRALDELTNENMPFTNMSLD